MGEPIPAACFLPAGDGPLGEPVGRSLVHAKTPWELYVAVGHGMLGVLAIDGYEFHSALHADRVVVDAEKWVLAQRY